MAIQIIQATRTPTGSPEWEKKKLRVAAYCRVSTDSAEQETSYEAQRRHYQALIEKTPDWTPAGIFADEGISGTQAKKRPEFLKMIEACEAGRVDLVVTKSLSRFSRNTVDCLSYIRKLKALGIPIFFEKENINTLDAKGEVLITIMACVAQQESESISQNVRIGIQYRMQQGKGRLNTSIFLGLRSAGKPGEYEIVPEEAEVVRRIFREYLDGYSPASIAARLEADGIRTGAGREHWHPSTVAKMLENEKYCGDLLLQKYYTEDALTHKVVKNRGRFPKYFVEGNHPPIVPREVFRQVQGELRRRSSIRGGPRESVPLSGKLICGRCGRTLKRFAAGDHGEPDWRCRRRAGKKTDFVAYKARRSVCGCRFIPEGAVKAAIFKAMALLPSRRDELIRTQAALRAGELKRIDALIEENRQMARELEERRVSAAGDEAAFLAGKCASLRERRHALALERAGHANRELHVRLLLELIEPAPAPPAEGWGAACADYEEFFLRTRSKNPLTDSEKILRYIEKVVVLDEEVEVHFKAGIVFRL